MIRILSILLLFTLSSYSQVINWSPLYPSISDTITITYNSSLGNSELIDNEDIYLHTGVLNKYSSSHHDWMNIPVQWHEGADTLIQMSSLGNNMYEITFKISSFFNFLECLFFAPIFDKAPMLIRDLGSSGSMSNAL